MIPSDGIRVDNLTKSYGPGRPPVLHQLSLRVHCGEIFGLIGPNGAGKTTFVGCLLGLLRPDRGTVSIGGLSPDDLELRRHTGYVPERLQFDRWMTGRQFVEYHHALAGRPRSQRRKQVEGLLERVRLERSAWDVLVKRYSRGMLQRVGLAQALVAAPRFLFLDEPSSGVDPAGLLVMREILAELRADGVTVVLNSHQLEEIERVCDRVAYLQAGSVRAIEDLHGADPRRRVVCVRWLPGAAGCGHELLSRIAREAGAELLELSPPRARFSVRDDDQAAALTRNLVVADVPLVEIGAEDGRLVRLFAADKVGAQA